MNITFYTESLKNTLLQAKQFTDTGNKSKLPILLKVQITAYENGLVTFSTFDMVNYATITTNANVLQPGKVIVECSRLLDMVKSGDSEIITLSEVNSLNTPEGSTTPTLLSVTCGSLTANMETCPDDFPMPVEQADWESVATFPGDSLHSTLSKILTVTSTDEARPILQGVHFSATTKGTLVEGTDGYRLTRITLPMTTSGFNFTLPGKTAKGLLSLIAPDMRVQMYSHDSQLKIMVGTKAQLIVTLLQGDFPKTEQIIPTTPPTACIKANRKEFVRQLQAVLKFNPTDTAHIVKLITDNMAVKLQATGPMGNITLSVPAIISGSMTTAYNAKLLLEIMKAMSGDTVELQLTDPLKPCLIEEPILTKAVSIIMPVRVSKE